MKKAFRAGALVLAILGFVAFFFVSWKSHWHLEVKEESHVKERGILQEQRKLSKVYRVGLPSSQWLIYMIDELQPAGRTYSGLDLYASSWSWLVLAAAIASVWAYLKLSPVAAAPTDRPSA